MFGALYLAMSLFWVLVVIIAIIAIIISISKNKLRTIFGINIVILIFTVLFFFVWFPVKENTVLNLKNGYSVSTEYNEAIPEVNYYLSNIGYLGKLGKIKDSWVGYVYNANEAIAEVFYVNSDFDLMEDEKTIQEEMKEIDKKSGYFIINSKEQTLHLTEEQVKEKLNVKKLNLKNPKKIIRKYGEKKEKSTFYKIIDDYFIPFSDKGIGVMGYEIIKYFAILILTLRIIYLRKLLRKRNQKKG